MFARIEPDGVPCDLEGAPFADPNAGTCALFDSIADARACCDAAVHRYPVVRYDLFDSDGRTKPPLLTILHPDRASTTETAPLQMRRRRTIAWALIVIGAPLIGYAYVEYDEHDIMLPAFFGINMILVGARLLWMNLALRETERAREARVAEATAARPASSSDSADPRPPSRHPAPR